MRGGKWKEQRRTNIFEVESKPPKDSIVPVWVELKPPNRWLNMMCLTYALVATPLHKLTCKGKIFPTGSKWIPGSDYDLAYNHVQSLMLDRPLYIWNKDNERHLFIKVDGCDDGWGACSYHHADKVPPSKYEGKLFLLSKNPKGSSSGYPRCGPSTRRKVFLYSTRRQLLESSPSSSFVT
jgi:hypothetical protein